jgi:tetratricopeptide (TPR) repeat protein
MRDFPAHRQLRPCRKKYFLAPLAILTLTMPVWAHKYKTSLSFDKDTTIKGTQLRPGSYQLAADDTKKGLNILRNGKVIATVQGQWVKLPQKPDYSSIVLDGADVTQVQFGGSGQAFRLRAYSSAEFAAYKSAVETTNPAVKLKALDDFVKQYPNSTIMGIYPEYYKTYIAMKNFAQAIEYCDRQIALGDKIDATTRAQHLLDAYYYRATAYYLGSSDKAFQTPEIQTKVRDAAVQGLKALYDWKKPDLMTADQFVAAVKTFKTAFTTIAAMASMALKDYPSAVTYYKVLVAIDPTSPVSHYSIGVAELQKTPPDANAGFFELARAIALKVPNAPGVQTYLKNHLIRYQQTSCKNLGDDQVNALITLATSSGDNMAATLNIPSAADLQKARNDTANFIPWLMEGGNHADTMWLATCGSQYADVPVRVMEVVPGTGDNITLKVYYAATGDQMQAASAPNMEIHVVGQPEAKRIQKDDYVRFTGTLTGYAQSPFLLTWDAAKVKALLFSANN